MISRRIFMKDGGMALLSLGFAPAFLGRALAAEGNRRKILIAIFQRGAVDGLNMVVPFGERAYYAARPTIAVPTPGSADGGAIDLDGFFGLHPRMAPLNPWFESGELAIVHATGSHHGTRSHFDAQDYLESATPGRKGTRDGWLNRYLQARREDASTSFRAVSLTPQMPRALQGTAPAVAMRRLSSFGIRAGQATNLIEASFEAEYAAASDQILGRTGREAFDAVKMLADADPSRHEPAHGAQYPRSPFGESLKQISQLIKADVGLEIAFAESGNWDHHINEGGSTGILANRLTDFAGGIAALATDLGDRMADVVILSMSEFGRAVEENGNRGTDHGHGNAMLVLGGDVRGGQVYGRWPGLELDERFERRDLAVTTDFRDVFGEIVVRHLGVRQPESIFPDHELDESRFLGFLG